MIEIIKYISFFSLITFLLFSVVLLLKQSPIKQANIKLAFIFIALSCCTATRIFKLIAYESGSFELLRYNYPLDFYFFAIIGPLVYLYVAEIYGIRPKLISYSSLFLLLSLIPTTTLCFNFYSLDNEHRIDLIIQNFTHLGLHLKLVLGFFYFQIICYFIYMYFFIQKHASFTHTLNVGSVVLDLRWAQSFFIFDLLLMIACTLLSIHYGTDLIVVLCGLTILNFQCFYIFINSLLQTGVFKEEIVNSEQSQIVKVEKKESVLLISTDLADSYIVQLTTIMQENKPFLLANFSIQDLSELSSISVHLISNCINVKLNKSFSDFVNEYRLELVKQQLQDVSSANLTIEAIGLQCGFGSKSSFNAVFKKSTQLTPTEYRKLYA